MQDEGIYTTFSVLPASGPELARAPPHLEDNSGCSTEDVVAILPKHTKVLVTGNNRTKRTLVGQEAVVKKAVGLGGWHWLVLRTGEEVKLQRNALSVLEYGPDDQQESSSDEQTETRDTQIEILTRPRIRRPPKALSPSPETSTRRTSVSNPSPRAPYTSGHSHMSRQLQQQQQYSSSVDLQKLETASLKRYRLAFQLAPAESSCPREELVDLVKQHFSRQEVEEEAVLSAFIRAVKRHKTHPIDGPQLMQVVY